MLCIMPKIACSVPAVASSLAMPFPTTSLCPLTFIRVTFKIIQKIHGIHEIKRFLLKISPPQNDIQYLPFGFQPIFSSIPLISIKSFCFIRDAVKPYVLLLRDLAEISRFRPFATTHTMSPQSPQC